MRKFSCALISVLFITILAPIFTVSADYTPPFDVTAEAVYMVNMDTGTVVYDKNSDKRMYPASLTKIMTTILAMESTQDLDGTMVTCPGGVWDEFEGIDISNAGIIEGEKRSMRDLVYCMMLPSANEAASVVARYLGDGSVNDFCVMMNKKAEELGTTDTHFVNPHGLPDDEHYTTAQDMFLIAKYAMSIPGFMDIASSVSYKLEPSNKRDTEYISTTNKLQVQSATDYYYKYARGIKTGTTDEAGRCVVTTATKDGYTYMIVLMGAPQYKDDGTKIAKNMAFVEAKQLFQWAFDSFTVKKLLSPEDPVTEVPLKLNWDKDYLQLKPESDFSALVPTNVDEASVQKKANVPQSVNAPVKAGDVIGTMEIMVAGQKLGSVNLLAVDDYGRSEVLYWFEILKAGVKTKWFFAGIGAFVVLLVIMIAGSIAAKRAKHKYSGYSRY